MGLIFKEFKDEIDNLVEFLTTNTWEFFGTPNPSPERIRANYENQLYTGEGYKTFWIILDDNIKVGILWLYDLDDGDPLFDIRISKKYIGMGIGTTAVNWLVSYVFNNYPGIKRIEANTRQDNYAMRCVFNKCGFAKESHHRKAWVGQDGIPYDSIGYGITREDWKSGKVTPVNWNDFKC
ncbi:acetyltransferase, GNAT family [Clostridiales bacterium oral taxon 876 str. F0540]|nr:acetyltransferase, GNAT family [Clostridiales bacterium oral taxon 876 str. F0540]